MKVGDRVRSPMGLTGTITAFTSNGFAAVRIDPGQTVHILNPTYPTYWLTVINEENPHERKPSRGT